MIYFYKRNFVVRFFSIICLVVILCMSPCVKYIDASSVDNVYATGLEIPATLGAEAAIEYMIAFFATLALGDAAYENRDALAESYMEYVDIKVQNDQLTQDTCMMIYDKTSDAVKSIPWEDFRDDLKSVHDISVDKLTDVYAKYCPQLLGNMKDFVTDVLSGDVYVQGLSDALIENDFVTASDIADQYNGHGFKLNMSAVLKDINKCNYCGNSYYGVYSVSNLDCFTPTAVYISGVGYHFRYINSSGQTDYFSPRITFTYTCCGRYTVSSAYGLSDDFISSFTANVPIFTSLEACNNYLKTGTGYENALNFGTSMEDEIVDAPDIPPFTKPWQQELWERVANAPDVIGIGSYGAGVGINDWATDIPWVGLGSLWDYVTSVDDAYTMVIDDVIAGVYDPTKDIPDTFADAWDIAIEDTWVEVMDIPLEFPGVLNPDIPVDSDVPIDIPIDSVIDIPIEDIVPTVEDSFLDIAASLKYKFPFSIPWDINHIFTVLADTPKAPYFELPLVIERYGINEKVVIDMSRFQVLSDLSRTMFSMLFAIFLINLTFRVVAMRKEE